MRTATFHDIEDLAKFCAELTRQGIAFVARPHGLDYVVELTGY
jgi:hypothetical protein